MGMELYILRHGIAGLRVAGSLGKDSQRRLTKQGARKLRQAAKGMKAAKLSFDAVLTSPYARARETAEIVVEEFRIEKALKLAPELTPEGSPRDLIEELKRHSGKWERVLLVGHEPYLSRLISVLLSGETRMEINFKKGGLCKVTVSALEFGRCAKLEWLLTPKQMRKMG